MAIGHAAAKAADAQEALNAAEQARLIKARVEQIVATGGYEVQSAGQAALETEDDGGDRGVLQHRLRGGERAGHGRADADREGAGRSRTRRSRISMIWPGGRRRRRTPAPRSSPSSVAATKSLTIVANSMDLVNRYAKQGDAIYAADLPIRKAGGQDPHGRPDEAAHRRVRGVGHHRPQRRSGRGAGGRRGHRRPDARQDRACRTGLPGPTVLDAQKEAAGAAQASGGDRVPCGGGHRGCVRRRWTPTATRPCEATTR